MVGERVGRGAASGIKTADCCGGSSLQVEQYTVYARFIQSSGA